MSRPAAPGSSAARWPGEAFGVRTESRFALPGVPPYDPAEVLELRTWAVRLRLAGELQEELRYVIRGGCDDAGLVGPTGEALRALGERLCADATTAADAAFAAAEQLDRCAVRIVLGLDRGDIDLMREHV